MYGQSLALELAYIAVEEAIRLGASYADVRFDTSTREDLRTDSGSLVRSRTVIEQGLGLRVLAQGAWGFMALAEPNRHDATVLARQAVLSAKASAVLCARPVQLVDAEPHRGLFRSPVEQDPIEVDLEEKLQVLWSLDEGLRRPRQVVMGRARIGAHRRRRILVSSEGAEIEQELFGVAMGMEAGASDGNRLSTLAYPCGMTLAGAGRGWEFLQGTRVPEEAQRLGEAAVEQLSAAEVSSGPQTVVLSSSTVAAHLLELGPLLVRQGNRGEGNAVDHEIVGRSIGTPDFSLYMDPTWSGGAGGYAYDDEGVPAEAIPVVHRGEVVNGLCSRAGAAAAGLERSTGSLRAGHFAQPPMVQPANWSMADGEAQTVDELIEDTKDGIFVESLLSLSASTPGGEFVAVAGRAWSIRDGRRVGLLRNVVYRGHGLELFTALDGVARMPQHGELTRLVEGGLAIGVAAPSVRVRSLQVGSVQTPALVQSLGPPTKAVLRRHQRGRHLRPSTRRDRF